MRVEWMWLVIVIILIRCNADEGGDAKISPKWLRGETLDRAAPAGLERGSGDLGEPMFLGEPLNSVRGMGVYRIGLT